MLCRQLQTSITRSFFFWFQRHKLKVIAANETVGRRFLLNKFFFRKPSVFHKLWTNKSPFQIVCSSKISPWRRIQSSGACLSIRLCRRVCCRDSCPHLVSLINHLQKKMNRPEYWTLLKVVVSQVLPTLTLSAYGTRLMLLSSSYLLSMSNKSIEHFQNLSFFLFQVV